MNFAIKNNALTLISAINDRFLALNKCLLCFSVYGYVFVCNRLGNDG